MDIKSSVLGGIMTSWKKYVLATVIVMTVGFVYVKNSHRNIPSDLRDAVADNGDFNTAIPVVKDNGNIPTVPKPKAEPATSQPVTFYLSHFTGLSVLADQNQPKRLYSKGSENVTGDVTGMIKGVALHNPTLDGKQFLALTGYENFSAMSKEQLELARATALCKFLGYGDATVATVSWLTQNEYVNGDPYLLEISGGKLLSVPQYFENHWASFPTITYYPASLAEVICAPKSK
jgi:hypothetical protein